MLSISKPNEENQHLLVLMTFYAGFMYFPIKALQCYMTNHHISVQVKTFNVQGIL